jgi:tryptophan synthase alpha subunit
MGISTSDHLTRARLMARAIILGSRSVKSMTVSGIKAIVMVMATGKMRKVTIT